MNSRKTYTTTKADSLNPIFTLSALALAGVAPLSAEALIYEPFEQAAGIGEPVSLTGATPGLGLSGVCSAGNNVVVQDPPTMSYGSLPNSGGELVLPSSASTNAWISTDTVLADHDLLQDGATLWFSMILRTISGGGANEWLLNSHQGLDPIGVGDRGCESKDHGHFQFEPRVAP